MTDVYLHLGAILAIIALISGGMFIFAKANYLLKIALATVVVGLSIYAWSISVAAFGYAINTSPQDKAIIIAINVQKKAGSIYFWIAEKEGPRAYRLPYSDSLGNEIAKAQAKAAANQGVMLFRQGHVKNQEGDGQGGKGNGNGNSDGKGGKGSNNAKGGKGSNAAGYGSAEMGGDAPIDVTIDVVPSLPEKN